MLDKLYNNFLFKYTKLLFVLFVVVFAWFLYQATHLQIDASANSLLLEEDEDLVLTKDIQKRFANPSILVVTFKPKGYLLDKKSLETISLISSELNSLDVVSSTTNILNVPLLQSPIRPIKELIDDIPTIETHDIDKDLVKQEFLNSALYKKALVSEDFTTTAIVVNLKADKLYDKNSTLSKKEYLNNLKDENHKNITKIRSILKSYENSGELRLGGVNMIADDLVEFVKSDLRLFGGLIAVLLVVVLYFLFRQIRWVVLPLFISFVSIVLTSGTLAMMGLDITVVSSNFISLQLIMNISLVIHLIVKYNELLELYPRKPNKELLFDTVKAMSKPSFFVVITTIAGFTSLVFSGIVPISNFGFIMSIGIVYSLLSTFILFPTILLFFQKQQTKFIKKQTFTASIASFVSTNKTLIIVLSVVFVLFSITGAKQLIVENSFIDYFKKDTDIYKGMKVLDQKLGGTTPLDIIITFKDNEKTIATEVDDKPIVEGFDDEFSDEPDSKQSAEDYWFTIDKLNTVKKVHNYLDSLDSVGKVNSLHTVATIGKLLNDNKELDSLTYALLYKELPKKHKDILLNQYVDIQNNQLRVSSRVLDSNKDLRRNELLKKIDKDLKDILDPKFESYKITNLLVIYNNMLQSLFDSQIKTISVVILILFIMFLILFRSFKLSLVAIVANTAPVGVIFGFLGWFAIPLDMMTITIAAISIGIAVDNTIHYIHRFKLEVKNCGDYTQAMFNSHKSIGKAMSYTSIVIVVGFAVLVLSNFIPTIYFGVLTIVAMVMAILSDLFLLPVLLLIFKPIGDKNNDK
ncbi:MAG: RND family transporter [Epsilonproteobacteria bacterium]|nr:MAG: RND family transporter [Campylobacterota bacterium]